MCLFQKERSRRTKLGAICVKTKKKPQNQKTHIQKLQNRRTKIKNKKKFIEIKSERKCEKEKKGKRLHIRYEDL